MSSEVMIIHFLVTFLFCVICYAGGRESGMKEEREYWLEYLFIPPGHCSQEEKENDRK